MHDLDDLRKGGSDISLVLARIVERKMKRKQPSLHFSIEETAGGPRMREGIGREPGTEAACGGWG
jgi:hypothetical protein